ncbi:MAG: hypothetical protein PHT94_04415 [Candidatus Nanoarchaeia archaeon]|nr:hypothetical protein [Candidatus Nanoarchaeia archaeon]
MINKEKLVDLIEKLYQAKENPSEELIIQLQQEIVNFEYDEEFTEHIIKFDLVIAKYYLQLAEIEFEKNNFQQANIVFNNVINYASQIRFLLEKTRVSDKLKFATMNRTNDIDIWKNNSTYYYNLNVSIEEKIEGAKHQLKSIKTSYDIQRVNLIIQEGENFCEELLRFMILEHANKFSKYLTGGFLINQEIRRIIDQHLDEKVKNYENKILYEMGENEYLRAKMDSLIEYPIEKKIFDNKEKYREDHISFRVNLIKSIYEKSEEENLLPFINFLKSRCDIFLDIKKDLFLKKIEILKLDIDKLVEQRDKFVDSIDHIQKELKEFEVISYIENIFIKREIDDFRYKYMK